MTWPVPYLSKQPWGLFTQPYSPGMMSVSTIFGQAFTGNCLAPQGEIDKTGAKGYLGPEKNLALYYSGFYIVDFKISMTLKGVIKSSEMPCRPI